MSSLLIQQSYPNKNKAVLVGLISFLDLYDNVRLSYREVEDSVEYQRQIEQSRIVSISKYILRSIAASQKGIPTIMFPNSIILACDNEFDDLNFEDKGHILNLKIPKNTMIVDGQHRFFGMKYLYEQALGSDFVGNYKSEDIINYINSFKFNCSILLNYDMWEQAQVFASVNFNQKKVNKSLFYDIYGVHIPLDDSNNIPYQNEIYLAHELVVFLENSSFSVFHGFVKMLGKGAGYVSQAFIVECLLKHLKPSGIWANAVVMMKDNNRCYNYIAYELTAYLAAVRHVFVTLWPSIVDSKPISLLCKTSGIGSILMLLKDLHMSLSNEILKEIRNNASSPITYAQILNYYVDALTPLKPFGEELFGLNSEYAAGAGAGMQTKLYKKMKGLLNIES